MWITILTIVIPILLKLAEYLFKKKEAGEGLTAREEKIVNRLNHATGRVRMASVSLGCDPDGVAEVIEKVAGGPLSPLESFPPPPLTTEQFIELQRLLKLGDKATAEEWEALEKSVGV